mgnify:CR=1 FL=1
MCGEYWLEALVTFCGSVERGGAECTSSYQDHLQVWAGVPPIVQEYRYAVEGNHIVNSEWLTDPDENAVSDELTMTALGKYDRWLHQNYREQWDRVFHEPWGELRFVLLPEAIPIHEQRVAEFLSR